MRLAMTPIVIKSFVDRLVKGMSYFASVILAIMMFLTAADVLLRYAFNRPLLGTIELTEFMMVILVFMALGFTQKGKGHVMVDLLLERVSPRSRLILETITGFSLLMTFVIMSWRLLKYAELISVGQYVSATWMIPFFPFVYIAAFGSIVMCLVILLELGGYLNSLAKMGGKIWGIVATIIICALVVFVFSIPAWMPELIADFNPYIIAILILVFLLILIVMGMPIAFALAVAGFIGTAYITGMEPGLSMLGMESYNGGKSYSQSVVPLFVLMGVFCAHSGLSRDLYTAAYKWVGRLPGGLAMATVAACAGFAAVTGSGAATTATIGQVALPEMKRYKYDSGLATACIAAGGSIGVLIPPSIPLAMYGILTQQSIGKLFLAGFIPGILQAIFYIVTIYILCVRNPVLGPKGPSVSFKEMVVSLKGTWGILLLFLIVIVGLYAGVFTPTEAAGAGAFIALLIALAGRRMGWKGFINGLSETVRTSGMILFILIGGVIFGQFLVVTRLPFELSEMLTGLAVSKYIILAGIIVVYIVLGMIMSSLAMIVITVPIFFPIITALGFDPIWFGILVTRMVEIGALTPPVGMNVFVIHGVARDVPMYTIFRGIMPFLLADLCHLVLLIAVPQISLFLPNMMK